MEQIRNLLNRAAFLRRPIGILCLIIGVLGWILPILPGWPFIVPAVALLGRRDPLVRYPHLWLRYALRRMRRAERRWLRGLGRRASTEYVRLRHFVTPLIVQAERALQPGGEGLGTRG